MPDPTPAPAAARVRVYVSHHQSSQEDAFTAQLVQYLQAAGADVLVDADGSPSGDFADFRRKTDERLAGRQWLVLVMTPDALRSHSVQYEVDAASRQVVAGHLRGIIAIVASPVEEGDLPPLWASWPRLDATRDTEHAFAGVVRVLGLIEPSAPSQAVPEELSALPPRPAPPPPAPAGAAPPPASAGTSTGAPAVRPKAPPAPPPPAPRAEPMPPPAATTAPRGAATLQFSAYHPTTVAVETWHTLLVYTYVAEALAHIQADASTFTELGRAPTIAQGQSTRAVARGVDLTIEPHMEGVTFSPASDAFVWREDWRRSLFRFSGASTLAGRAQHGWIDIYAGAGPMVPIARIDLTFPFHTAGPQHQAASAPRGVIVTSNIYDTVFISYSHRDTEAFHQACEEYQRFGVTTYTDEQLEAGAQYERELSRMIAEAKIFHLLWSPNSARSPECRKEWLSALQREPTERFIKPWYWSKPLAAVPAEFVQYRISFKYEPLKRSLWRPATWFR